MIDLNRAAIAVMGCKKALKIVPGATHLFEEPRTLEAVMHLAGDWFEQALAGEAAAQAPRRALQTVAPSVERQLEAALEPLPDIDDEAFAVAFDRYAEARVVLIGEASHGTSEFYRARAAITRCLIERHGFEIVAVEADWPDAAAIDRHVLGPSAAQKSEYAVSRFPTWMWRNTDVDAFVAWLRGHNQRRRPPGGPPSTASTSTTCARRWRRCSLILDRRRPTAAKVGAPALRLPGALERGTRRLRPRIAERRLMRCARVRSWAILRDMVRDALDYAEHDGERFFDAAQNARVVADAERYYRVMYYGADEVVESARPAHVRDPRSYPGATRPDV